MHDRGRSADRSHQPEQVLNEPRLPYAGVAAARLLPGGLKHLDLFVASDERAVAFWSPRGRHWLCGAAHLKNAYIA
jgi:hypothetical protein